MTHDLLTLSDECRQSQIDAIALLSALSPHFNKTITQISETLCNSFSALREAQAEIERKGRQLEKSEREYLDIRTERDTAIADNARLRAELEAAKCLSKHAVECMDRCCPQCNAAMKEKA